jgi:hypothetical protein
MKKIQFLFIMTFAFVLFCTVTTAKPRNDKKNNKLLTNPTLFDKQINDVGNYRFFATNFGIFAYEGLYWPRDSNNQYLFSSGIWLGCKRTNKTTTNLMKYVQKSYDPNTGLSRFVPGSIDDGKGIDLYGINKNKVYLTDDYWGDGTPFDKTHSNWLLWKTAQNIQTQLGQRPFLFENDVNRRNLTNYPFGPMMAVYGYDIIASVCKDTYIDSTNKDYSKLINRGYPLNLNLLTIIYTGIWRPNYDIIILNYKIENKSNDTLFDCWLGGVFDPDIGHVPGAKADNDKMKYLKEDPLLNLAVAWTDALTAANEINQGIGYIGISLIETPAVKSDGFLRNDKIFYSPSEQVGMKTMRSWRLDNDVVEDDECYDFMSSGTIDGDFGPGDLRLIQATGSFNMAPGDVANISFAMAFAVPYKGGEADGTLEDMAGLDSTTVSKGKSDGILANENTIVGKIKFIKDEYYKYVNSSWNGIDDKKSDNSDSFVYPNPANNFLYIKETQTVLRNTEYSIFSIEGSIIQSGKFNNKIDISSLKTGFYFIKVNGKVSKFIKI